MTDKRQDRLRLLIESNLRGFDNVLPARDLLGHPPLERFGASLIWWQ
ncbi:hypothetical protein [Bradyrhizobium hipponense]|nr:hypothetical protein [Bradyrhizobium hipponense]